MQEFWNVLAQIKIDSNYRQTSVCCILEKLHFTFKTVPKRLFFCQFSATFFLTSWLNFFFSCSVTQGLFMFKHFFCHPRSFLVLKSICLSSTKWKKDDYSHSRFHMRKKRWFLIEICDDWFDDFCAQYFDVIWRHDSSFDSQNIVSCLKS